MLETQWRFHNTHCLTAYTGLGLCLLVHMKSVVIAIGHVSAKPRMNIFEKVCIKYILTDVSIEPLNVNFAWACKAG